MCNVQCLSLFHVLVVFASIIVNVEHGANISHNMNQECNAECSFDVWCLDINMMHDRHLRAVCTNAARCELRNCLCNTSSGHPVSPASCTVSHQSHRTTELCQLIETLETSVRSIEPTLKYIPHRHPHPHHSHGARMHVGMHDCAALHEHSIRPAGHSSITNDALPFLPTSLRSTYSVAAGKPNPQSENSNAATG